MSQQTYLLNEHTFKLNVIRNTVKLIQDTVMQVLLGMIETTFTTFPYDPQDHCRSCFQFIKKTWHHIAYTTSYRHKTMKFRAYFRYIK